MCKKIVVIKSLFVFSLILVLPRLADAAESYTPYAGVIHIHSEFSSGDQSIPELVEMARELGLKYLVVTDHDLVTMEYGLFPFRNLIKKREKRPSLIQAGPRNYLQTIAKINQAQKEVLVIPGAQSSPYYYWTGSPLRRNLTANDYQKEILLVGIFDPDFFSSLPVLHHGPSTRLLLSLLPELIFPLGAAFISMFLIQRSRRLGTFALILSLLFLANARPWRTSIFTPYDGDQGIRPYQNLIDYSREKDALTFWAHPESNYSTQGKELGPVTLKTEKYATDLLLADSYTGFSAIYGDTTEMEKPGREWDVLLQQYCKGSRDESVWAIAGADFHGVGKSQCLDTYVTVLWANRLDDHSLINALQNGRCYAVRQSKGRGLRLDRFHLENGRGEKAWSGETIFTTKSPLLTVDLSVSDGSSLPVRLRVIRNGVVWHEVQGQTPLSIRKKDETIGKGKNYYRIEAIDRSSLRLISNPIFVET